MGGTVSLQRAVLEQVEWLRKRCLLANASPQKALGTATSNSGPSKSGGSIHPLETRVMLSGSITLNPGSQPAEGFSWPITATYDDHDTNLPAAQWTFDWGDGVTDVFGGATSQFSHVYAQDGNYSLIVTAEDQFGSSVETVSAVSVAAAGPWFGITGPATASAGSPYTLLLAAAEHGTDELSGFSVYWGDGYSDYASAETTSLQHFYAAHSPYTITAYAFDTDGSTVANQSLQAVGSPPAPTAASGSVNEGDSFNAYIAGNDPDQDVVAWSANWGDGTGEQAYAGNPDWLNHAFTQDGNLNATFTAIDSEGNSSSVTIPITVFDVPGQAWITGPGEATAFSEYTLGLNYADPGDSAANWTVFWGDGQSSVLPGSVDSATHIYENSNAVYVSAVVTNDDGQDTSAPGMCVAVASAPETAWAGGASQVDEGADYEIDTGFLDHYGGPASSWNVNWGDGTTDTVAGDPGSFTHVYDTPGDYTITATAANEHTQASSSVEVEVADLQGQILVAPPGEINEGSDYALTVGYSNPAGDALSGLTIDWGDGQSGTVSPTETDFTHTYSDDGDYTVVISAVDDDGQAVSTSVDATVDEVDGWVGLVGEPSVPEGSEYTLYAGYTDPADGLSSWDVDWGDGQSDTYSAGTDQFTHVYSDPAYYDIAVTATDDDGRVWNATQRVQATNTIPTVTASVDNMWVDVGQTVTVTATFDDPAGDVTKWYIDWGDGQLQEATPESRTFTHAYAAGSPDGKGYGITVTAVGEDGLYPAYTGVYVTEAAFPPPETYSQYIAIGGPSQVDEWSNLHVDLGGSYISPDENEPGTYVIDWGDGSSDQGEFSGNAGSGDHVYQHEGRYPITATADNGGKTRAWVDVFDVPATFSPMDDQLVVPDQPVSASAGFTATDQEDIKESFADMGDGLGFQYVGIGINALSASISHALDQVSRVTFQVFDRDGNANYAYADLLPVSLSVADSEPGDIMAVVPLTHEPDGSPTGNPLVPLHINLPNLPVGTTVELSLASGMDKVSVWEPPDPNASSSPLLGVGGASSITWTIGSGDPPPTTLFVSGEAESSYDEVDFELHVTPPPASPPPPAPPTPGAPPTSRPTTNPVTATQPVSVGGTGRLDVLKVNHNTAGDPLSEKEKKGDKAPGAFVPVNNDDDDYSINGANLGDDSKQIDGKGANDHPVTGEDDLLPIVLHAVPNAPAGSHYSLTIPSFLRVWTANDADGRIVKNDRQFPANQDTTLYVEALGNGSANIDLKYQKQGDKGWNAVDRVKVTAFYWLGALNVAGNSTTKYTVADAPNGAKWIEGTHGTVVDADHSGRRKSAEYQWSGGHEVADSVSKAIFKVNSDYLWDLEVNVVEVVVGNPENKDAFVPGSGVEGPVVSSAIGLLKTVDSGRRAQNDGLVWQADITLNGPSRAGKADCGVSQMQVGFIQNATLSKLRANYNGINNPRVNKLEGSTLFDADPDAKRPYFSRREGTTFLNPSPQKKTAKIGFADTPTAVIPVQFNKNLNGQNLITHLDLVFNFALFVVGSTLDDRNNASEVYASEAKGNWQWDASQNIGPAPDFAWNAALSKVTPPTNKKWQTDSSGYLPKTSGILGNTAYQDLRNW